MYLSCLASGNDYKPLSQMDIFSAEYALYLSPTEEICNDDQQISPAASSNIRVSNLFLIKRMERIDQDIRKGVKFL